MIGPKEKAQGITEYALILALTLLVIIFALQAIGPIVGRAVNNAASDLTKTSEELLSNAPIVGYKTVNPIAVDSKKLEQKYFASQFFPQGCSDLYVNSNQSIKVGTDYSDPIAIQITRVDKNKYAVCSNVVGDSIRLFIGFVDTPR
jgi:Flp pilus assembly pilin Flp